MKRNWLVCTLILGAVALLAGAAVPGPAFQFTSINFPGAVLTEAEGINPGGTIVGLYVDSNGKQHGFLLSGGNFSSIDYPGASATIAFGINPGGDIVGDWNDGKGNGTASIHGFLLSGGTFSEVQFPGYRALSPEGSARTATFMAATTTRTLWRACTVLCAPAKATQPLTSLLP